ncbi:MAG: hypothetical protein V3V01_11060, partial [Acidimicrobiales bacterium]
GVPRSRRPWGSGCGLAPSALQFCLAPALRVAFSGHAGAAGLLLLFFVFGHAGHERYCLAREETIWW